MPFSLTTYGTTPQIQIVTPTPTGPGGLADQNNQKAMVDYNATQDAATASAATAAASAQTTADSASTAAAAAQSTANSASTSISTHAARTDNPHAVTTSQIGAVSSTATQTANTVLSGPTTGSAAAPTFRALVAADVPSLTLSKISNAGTMAAQNASAVAITGGTLNNQIRINLDTGLIKGDDVNTSGQWDLAAGIFYSSEIDADTLFVSGDASITGNAAAATFSGSGANLTSLNASNLSSGTVPTARLGTGTANSTTYLRGDNTWATVSGGSGTVTSVALTAPSAILSVSGSPVTTSGTLALSLANQNANVVFAGPSTGSAAAPTFRSLVNADIPATLSITTLTATTLNAAHLNMSGGGIIDTDGGSISTGTLNAVTGTFSGDISAANLIASTAVSAPSVTATFQHSGIRSLEFT